jgi:HEAT repeat protein
MDELLGYWSNRYRRGQPKPSDEVRQRLLGGVQQNPEYLPRILDVLPDDAETLAQVKKLYDAEHSSGKRGDGWGQNVHDWLMLNGPYFRSALIEAAVAAKDDDDGWVVNEDELRALAKVDWQAAQEILERHYAKAPARVAILALTLQYRHAMEVSDLEEAERLRNELKAIVSNRREKGYSRDVAVEVLLETEWNGRDEWYFSLMKDESIRELHDGDYLMKPLNGPVVRNPDVWIPKIAALVDNEDRAVHDHAVSMLIQFHIKQARSDALRPLIPWLSDPEWSSARDRLRLIQSVERLDLREAIPGLIHVVETEEGATRGYAAAALAGFRAKEAGPALRKALEEDNDAHHRRMIVRALLECDGLTTDELVNSVEAFAVQVSTEEGVEAWEEYSYMYGDSALVKPEVSIGAELRRSDYEPTSGLVDALLNRLERLQSSRGDVADTIRETMAMWSDPDVDRAFASALRSGTASSADIAAALRRREGSRVHIRDQLQEMAAAEGVSAGVAAAMLGERALSERLIHSSDNITRAALLAASRLTRDELPIVPIAKLMDDENALLSLASERYLEIQDSAEARRHIHAHRAGEAKILGSRMSYDPGHFTFPEFDELEESLRQEILEQNGPEEIYALLSAGYWGGAGQRIIRISAGNATLSVCTDPARCRNGELPHPELEKLREMIEKYQFEDLGPLDHAVSDGMQYEYLHLTKQGGRRVFMNNPGVAGGTPYDLVTNLFLAMEEGTNLHTQYHAEKAATGLELLISHEDAEVHAVCGENDRLVILVTEQEAKSAEWHTLTDTRLGIATAVPECCTGFGAENMSKRTVSEEFKAVRNAWQVHNNEQQVLIGNWDRRGLWRETRGKNLTRLVDGWFGGTIVTLDGKWAIAARTAKGENWAVPNPVVRVAVESGDEHVVDVAPADWFAPIAYLSVHQRVLLKRMADEESYGSNDPEGPAEPEYRLLDPNTGLTTVVTGEFTPLEQLTYREFQPVASDVEGRQVWVALPDHRGNSTTVGTYDQVRFELVPQATYPSIAFSSPDMWVDEEANHVYIAYRGDLVRVPLDSAAAK